MGVEIRHFLAARPEEARAARTALFEQVASGALAKPQTVRFPLAQSHEALAATSRRDKVGKVTVVQQTEASSPDR